MLLDALDPERLGDEASQHMTNRHAGVVELDGASRPQLRQASCLMSSTKLSAAGVVYHSDRGMRHLSIRCAERLVEADIEISVRCGLGDDGDHGPDRSVDGEGLDTSRCVVFPSWITLFKSSGRLHSFWLSGKSEAVHTTIIESKHILDKFQ